MGQEEPFPSAKAVWPRAWHRTAAQATPTVRPPPLLDRLGNRCIRAHGPVGHSYTMIGARSGERGADHGATGQFCGFMGVEPRARRQTRPRGITAPRCCTLTADGSGAADAATNIHRALHLRSSRAVAVAGEVADLQSARQQVAAAASRRRRGPHRQNGRHGPGGRRARWRKQGDAAGWRLYLQATGGARAQRRWRPSLAASCPASGRRSK